jgi:hypothetical protein
MSLGNCGKWNKDTDTIVALSSPMYFESDHCDQVSNGPRSSNIYANYPTAYGARSVVFLKWSAYKQIPMILIVNYMCDAYPLFDSISRYKCVNLEPEQVQLPHGSHPNHQKGGYVMHDLA